MSKKIKPVPANQEDFEAALKSEPQVFDGVALSIAKNTEGGFNIVKITFDPKGLEAGEVKVLDTADNRTEANEKFKIHVVKERII